VSTGECQHILNEEGDDAWVVTYSPQGNQVATAGDDGIVRMWDVESGVCQHTLTDHSARVQRIVYSPNGNQIASASRDKTVRLWDVKTGMCSHIFIGHREEVTRVVYSPRGHQVASASYDDRTVRLWDTESGECHHTLVGHKEPVAAIAYSQRGNLIASWSGNGEAILWDVETGDCCWTLDYDGSTRPMNSYLAHPFVWMSLNVDSFITGDGSGSVTRWDVIREGDQFRVQLRWRSTNGQLTVENACVQDVQGLSDFNKRLLKQRGATGEPTVRLRETSKNVMRMASVVSKLKSSSSNTEALNLSPTSPAISSTRHTGQTVPATDAESTIED
jgi:WD40 repeat protein